VEIIVRKSCPYSSDQLVEAANGGCTDAFKIKTRGTMRTVGSLRLYFNVPWAKDKLAERDLSWMKE